MSLDIILDESSIILRIAIYTAIQNYNNLNRSKEEQNIIKSEIIRLSSYWIKQEKLIETAIEKYKMQEQKVK